MSIQKIITYPNPLLRKKNAKVTTFDDDLKKLVQDMKETMYDAPGIGLAANQIGVSKQVVLIDISEEEDEKKFMVLVNPVLTDGQGTVVDEEGCLSVIDYTAKVKRFQKIHVTAQDVEGNPVEFDAEDRFARIIQHEVDHIFGKLFIDRISALKRGLYKKKLAKILRNQT